MDEYINLNVEKVNDHVFEGFGTSLCWFANALGTCNNEIKDHLCHILFDQNSKDSLQLNIVRYNIGGVLNNDNDKINFRAGAKIQAYDLNDKNKWDNTDLGQRFFLKKAKELGVSIFEAFSNSPPENLTISGSPQGHKHRCKNNIEIKNIEKFTDYLVSVLNYLKENDDIHFNTISPMNEPSGPGWIIGSGQEGCFYNFLGIRKKLLKSLHQKLIDTTCKVSACEENNMFQALFGILINPFMWKYVDQYNIHRYTIDQSIFNGKTYNLEDANIFRRIIYTLMNRIYKKKIWMSEWGMGQNTNEKDIDVMIKFAKSLMNDFIYLKPSAWIYWQVIENLSSNGWGCLQIPFHDPKIENIVYNVQFTIFQHFTHYIKPGSYILKLKNPKNNKLKWIGCVKNNKISLIILSENNDCVNLIFPFHLYNINIMCSFKNQENVLLENNFIHQIKMITLKPMSLTSISFSTHV